MAFGSGISRDAATDVALDAALGQALDGFESTPDLGFVFATHDHLEAAHDLAAAIDRVARVGVGAIAEGVIGDATEIEGGPGLAVWLGSLPRATLNAKHLQAVRTPRGVVVEGAGPVDDIVGTVMIADPFTFPTGGFITEMATSGLPVVGGFANAGRGPGGAALLQGGHVRSDGALVITFAGEVAFRPIVSQGCRPIGEPAVITAGEGTTVAEIAGRSALGFLRGLLAGLDPGERATAARGLQIGVAVDEYQTDLAAGDFLIRGITGIDEESGALTVGDRLEIGTTVQFQVRDPAAADDELRRMLDTAAPSGGVLLFSCNARGERFFGSRHHDAATITEIVGPPALAGFFAAGEIGPVGAGNFVHTFTASMLALGDTVP